MRNLGPKIETVTQAQAAGWVSPPFQRRLILNRKVKAIATTMRATEEIPGVIVLGVLGGVVYLVDGQHRRQAFKDSGASQGVATVVTFEYADMAEMSSHYRELNSKISFGSPDDTLKAMAFSNDSIKEIKARCPFIGYGTRNRVGANAENFVSMAAFTNAWNTAGFDALKSSFGSAISFMGSVSTGEAVDIAEAANAMHRAWGVGKEMSSLWKKLNVVCCLWFWRRSVLGWSGSSKANGSWKRSNQRVPAKDFERGFMSLSANGTYLDWLVGRSNMGKDSQECARRVKLIILDRIESDTGTRPPLPTSSWFGQVR